MTLFNRRSESAPMARYRLHISYDGTDFCGWQRQKEHKHGTLQPSIQQTLEEALSSILNHDVELSASGRTDAGVHALNQVVHFKSERKMPADLCWALKSKLPSTISAKALYVAPDDFHATLSAVDKTYRYWIWNHPRAPALLGRYSWWIRNPIRLDFLNEACRHLIGTQDFASFRSMGTPVRHTVRRIDQALWTQKRAGLIEFSITGGGFMKQMVRNIVGTAIDLEKKDKTTEMMKDIIALKDRTKAGTTAPPQGLFLVRVRYPKSLDNKCRQI